MVILYRNTEQVKEITPNFMLVHHLQWDNFLTISGINESTGYHRGVATLYI